jgi:ATP-dependent exoDNAse (exonuclease V) alpha subunit
LASSATAAAVLGEDLGIPVENTAKWLTDHDLKGAVFRAGQLVIVDEASPAGTLTLDRIASLANQAGAKVLLVGDWAQLQAVDAGGGFNLLVADRETVESVASADHWAGLVRASGLSEDQAAGVVESEAFGALCAELRSADANRQPVAAMLAAAVRRGGLDTAGDPAAPPQGLPARPAALPAPRAAPGLGL